MENLKGSVARERGAGEAPLVNWIVGDLILSHVLPASVFGILLVAQADKLIEYWQVSGDGFPRFVAHVSQQSLSIAFLALLVTLFLIRRPLAGKRSSPIQAGVAILGTFLLVIPVAATVVDQTSILVISGVLMLAGTAIAIIGLAALGRCFGLFPEARGLVTRGPYRWIRHPVYLGEIVATLGVVIGAWSAAMLGMFLIWVVLQYTRTRMEERALLAVFPDYATYQQRTYRLLPPFR